MICYDGFNVTFGKDLYWGGMYQYDKRINSILRSKICFNDEKSKSQKVGATVYHNNFAHCARSIL